MSAKAAAKKAKKTTMDDIYVTLDRIAAQAANLGGRLGGIAEAALVPNLEEKVSEFWIKPFACLAL